MLKRNFWVILLVLLSLISIKSLFAEGFFSMHDDLQIMRLFQLEKCFSDGQIPCRWAPDMSYGYGQPMFNFYSAFPYYLGTLIRTLSPLSLIWTIKMLFAISLIASSIGMYLLSKEFFGKAGGFLSAILYTFAPYHALDVFVRGALAESFALGILPFMWFAIYRLIKKPNFNSFAVTSLAIFALFTTHNLSTLMYAPFTLAWALMWLIKFRSKKSILSLGGAGVLGLGLSSFFILPIIFERSLVQLDFLISDYMYFGSHFASFKQLFFERSWGYGPSVFGPDDDISFQLGWPHWVLVLLSAAYSLFALRKRKKEYGLLALGFGGLFFFTAFLSHLRSFPIWESLPILAFVQFPWRFLGLAMFFGSLSAGYIAQTKSIFSKKPSIILIAAITVLLNFQYFTPQRFYTQETDQNKLSGANLLVQQGAATLDYLPKTAQEAPKSLAPKLPEISSGKGEIRNFYVSSNKFSFDARIVENAFVQIPITFFPEWKVIINNVQIPITIGDPNGTIVVPIPKGEHIVIGRFENTKVRSMGNAITLASMLGLLAAWLVKENKYKAS